MNRAFVLCCVLAILPSSCQIVTEWETILVSHSPDKNLKLVYSIRPFFGFTRDRLDVSGSGIEEVLKHPTETDINPELIEAVWSGDSEQVYFLACYTFTPRFLKGYDLKRRRDLPIETVKSAIEKALRARYPVIGVRLTTDEVIDWACSEQGRKASRGISLRPLAAAVELPRAIGKIEK